VAADEEASQKDTHDELSLLPANKRRKLQQLNRSRKKVELVSQMATSVCQPMFLLLMLPT